uniref:Diacylglycerol O-acyltransferase n=1 Tax=Kalanchoe fedtschenkoi TaxID=63787 RepID=A0A7N0RAU3_KALFE
MAHSLHATAAETASTAAAGEFVLAMPTPIKTLKPEHNGGVEEDGQPLSPVSQLFHKPDSNSYILAIFGFKTLVDVDHFKEQMVGFARGHRRFRSLQVGNKEKQKLKWVSTEVDIHKHVIAPEIDPAQIIGSGEKFLEDYLHNLSKTGIDMSKPLWEFHILNGVETCSSVKSVGIGRIHHSLGDGTSLMLYFLTFARKASSGTAITAATLIPVRKNTSSGGNGSSSSMTQKIKRNWNLCRNTFVDVLTTLATTSVLKDTKNPASAPADTGRAPRRIVQRCFSLDDIKLIKAATNTKVNDILMAILEAGLSRYLNRKYGEMGNCKGQKNCAVPNIRLRTLVTFNLRMTQPISQGLYVNVTSYGNKLTFALSVDERAIPDPHQLCDDLEDSLTLIKKAATAT